ncbi:unnamed protein product [Ceutorhynchus assimilis]|uniref:Neuropeptide-like 1 n=1 Tax=Ceutorhynchus assimilis TaxID=467358 RepID=A0A9N9MNK0_9CUCU|nr:unnamed protein product [Ceutorhynchus assimilis]
MGNLGLINFSVWCVLVACGLIDKKVNSDSSCDIEISETLRTLLNPEANDSIHVQALRRQLLRKLKEDLDLAELEDDRNYKRNLASLAAWNNLPGESKRNLESLARAGTWYKIPPELDHNGDLNYKRSIDDVAKTNQPSMMDNQKRGIEALARNGELRHLSYRMLPDTFDYKRTLGNFDQNFPVGATAGFGKRFVGSLAKNGILPYAYGKRNIQSLARDGALGKRSVDNAEAPDDKRSIQSVKAQQRNKREADYFENELIYQMPVDYEDILQDLAATTQDAAYPVEDKRFLGSVAKTGWFRPTTRGITSLTSLPDKRHVAALARLGWLPAYRSVRRFNRSGRSFLKADSNDDICKWRKEDSSNGKTKNYSYTKITSVPLNYNRYLLKPAADNNNFIKKVFRHPRMTLM